MRVFNPSRGCQLCPIEAMFILSYSSTVEEINITSLFTHLIYNKVVKLIFLISLINTQIIDEEFYTINIKKYHI